MVRLKHGIGMLCLACAWHGYCVSMQPGKQVSPFPQEKWRPAPPLSEQVLFDETRGNWYYKREYYRKARELYYTLRKKVDGLNQLKDTFFKKRSETDKEVAEFNAHLGFEEGRIDELLHELAQKLESERRDMIELTEEERDLERQVKEGKQSLEQLKLDLTTTSDLDNALDESIGQVLKTMNKARSYQERGWKSYQAIGQELNDRKAEQLYVSIQADINNVDNLRAYLTNKLQPYINRKVQELRSLMSKVRHTVKQLESQGIYLSKELAEEIALDKKRKEEELQRERAKQAEAKKKAQQAQGWWQRFKQSVSSFGRALIFWRTER